MSDDSAGAAGPRYRAFISYSHADARFAGWLHRKLERHRLPDRATLAPIFIDRAELAAGPDLSAQVRAALAQSAALVVVASPAARASRWVAQEIALYRELHPDRPVYAALIEGEPGQAFPEALLSQGGKVVEPLAADFRKGHDGHRLGLLKIVAGLTGQPLDQLVQRDAQSRQRRVMAITAGALLLSLILSAALVVAIRARSEAERQRAEAEGLVEFMLTDLRDKLKGVGRLDVMDAVNQRAIRYYGSQENIAALLPDSLARRARLIEAMGQDDELRGELNLAEAKYAELHRITAALLDRDPTNPDRIFAHAASENRLALIDNTRGKPNQAIPRFLNAQALLNRLAGPPRPEWEAMRSLVEGNLCAITLKATGQAQTALVACRTAVTLALQQVTKTPNSNAIQYDLAFHYLWLGDAAEAAGEATEADVARKSGLELSEALMWEDPSNMAWREQHVEVCLHLAKIAARKGQPYRAKDLGKRALSEAEQLVNRDPSNRFWSGLLQRAQKFTKES